MKKCLFFLIPFFGVFLTSCHEETDDPSSDSSTDKKDFIYLYYANEDIQFDIPAVRFMAEYDEWIVTDVTSDGCEHQDGHAFYFINKFEPVCMMVYGTPKGFVIAGITDEDGNYINNLPSTVVMVTKTDNGYRMSEIQLDVDAYKTLAETTITISEPMSVNRRRTPADYFSEYNRMIIEEMDEFFDALGEDVDAITEIRGMKTATVGMIGAIWTKLAIPVSKIMVDNSDPARYEKMMDEQVISITDGLLCKMIGIAPIALARKAKELIMSGTATGYQWSEAFYSDWNDDEQDTYLPMFTASRLADTRYYNSVVEYAEVPSKYEVSASYRNVTENSVDITASWSCLDGSMSYISSMGYLYNAYGDNNRHDFPISDISGTHTVGGLQPFTRYQLTAYLNSFGTTYRSRILTFFTKGELHPSPSSLHFTAAGGTQDVLLNVPADAMKSWNVSVPGWCRVEKKAESFSVTALEATVQRSGSISLSVTLSDGETKQTTIGIEQDAPKEISRDWNGTSWNFPHNQIGFQVQFTNINNQQWNFSGFIDNSHVLEIAQLSNGDLEIHTATGGGYMKDGNLVMYTKEMLITLHRKSIKEATAKVQYTFADNNNVDKGIVNINGTLIVK